MRKTDELEDPNSCLNRAHLHEELFVLLGRDAAAPCAIRAWCMQRVLIGKNQWSDRQIVEALECANRIEGELMQPIEVDVSKVVMGQWADREYGNQATDNSNPQSN